MNVTVFTLKSYLVVSKHVLHYDGEIGTVTPEFVVKVAKDGKLKGVSPSIKFLFPRFFIPSVYLSIYLKVQLVKT